MRAWVRSTTWRRECWNCPEDLQLIALAGRNAELLKRLQALARKHPGRLFPLGFTTTVERVMTAADLVVTKPGGLSVSECLAKRKPMLLVSPIPGQEERNADYLLEAGARSKPPMPLRWSSSSAACSVTVRASRQWVRRRTESPGPMQRARCWR